MVFPVKMGSGNTPIVSTRYMKALKDPSIQALSARYSLEKWLNEKLNNFSELSVNPVFGFAVIFPDRKWDEDTTEMPRVLVADMQQCLESDRFSTYLRKVFNYWNSKSKSSRLLDKSDLGIIKGKLRPNVDVFPPFTTKLGEVLEKMQELTEEQYERMEIIDQNEKVVVRGGAGTGKTFLMLQCARKEIAKGFSVMVFVHSKILASYIKKIEPDERLQITSLENIDQVSRNDKIDVLFVDEGQDLMDLEILGYLDAVLSGGMEKGRWRWFMDDNNQTHVKGTFDQDAYKLLCDGFGTDKPVSIPLLKNVRNTKEIIRNVESWTGTDLGDGKVSGYGQEPKIYVIEQNDGIELLEKRLDELIENEVSLDQIGVVFSLSSDLTLIKDLKQNLRRKFIPLNTKNVKSDLKGRVVYGYARDFKGLEKNIIITFGFRKNGFERKEKRILCCCHESKL